MYILKSIIMTYILEGNGALRPSFCSIYVYIYIYIYICMYKLHMVPLAFLGFMFSLLSGCTCSSSSGPGVVHCPF